MKLVEIDWIDSNCQWGWTKMDKLKEDATSKSLICRTVGYLIVDEPDRVALVQSLAWSDVKDPPASGDAMLVIPRTAIMAIRNLSGGRKVK